MAARSVIFLVFALLIGIPILIFVVKNLKAGWDDAEKTRPSLSKDVDPNTTHGSLKKSDLQQLAATDFSKLDFSDNTTAATDTTHAVEKLPALDGTAGPGFREGLVQQGKFEVRGGVQRLSGATRSQLESARHAGGKVTIEVVVGTGRVRAYLLGLKGSVVSGFVYAYAEPGHPARITGYLQDWSDSGSPRQDFYLQALVDDAKDIAYRVYRAD